MAKDDSQEKGHAAILGIDPIGEYVSKRFGELQGMRVNWESHWEEIARYIVPNKDDIWDNQTKGERKTDHLFDSSAKRYCNELANAFHSMLTNPTTEWFNLSTGNRNIDANKPVRLWMQEVVTIMLQVLNNSNFQQEVLETYQELASFGTAPIRIEEDDEDIVRFYSRPIYKCFISENNKKQIDFLIRKYKFTVRQIHQQWGAKALTPEMQKEIKATPNKEYEILHAVGPRKDLKRVGIKTRSAKPFYSFHVLHSSKKLLNKSSDGFHEFPYAVPRWSKIAGETYGRSPGMDVLPDIKTINAMKKVVLQGAQIAVAPPLQATDNSLMRPMKFKPFGMNYRRPGSDPIQPIVTGADPRIGLDLIEEVKTAINEGFFIHQLRMVQADRMTATEVMQRRDEQLRGLGGILGRLQNELLAPVINRTFGILLRGGHFPPMPEELAETGRMEIKYTSMLAKAQISGEAESVQRALAQVMPLAEMQPQIFENIDGDALLRISFEQFGVDERFLKPEEEVMEAREKAEQQQAQAQEAEMGVAQSEQMRNAAPMMKQLQEGGGMI